MRNRLKSAGIGSRAAALRLPGNRDCDRASLSGRRLECVRRIRRSRRRRAIRRRVLSFGLLVEISSGAPSLTRQPRLSDQRAILPENVGRLRRLDAILAQLDAFAPRLDDDVTLLVARYFLAPGTPGDPSFG
jgi:hypothetical protein